MNMACSGEARSNRGASQGGLEPAGWLESQVRVAWGVPRGPRGALATQVRWPGVCRVAGKVGEGGQGVCRVAEEPSEGGLESAGWLES